MELSNLKCVSEDVLGELRENVTIHLKRYLEGDFEDLSQQWGWAVDLKTVRINTELFAALQGGNTSPEAEIENSLIVHDALPGMTRALAREERVWTRLTHVECLEYSRSRWLAGVNDPEEKISTHFFAGSLNQVRDDNAIGRLWWNAEIARIASPEDIRRGLGALLKTSDIRLNFIERPGIASRPELAQAIVRVMEADDWVTEKQHHFRMFMRLLNRNGGGVLFEAWDQTDVDNFVIRSREQAEELLAA